MWEWCPNVGVVSQCGSGVPMWEWCPNVGVVSHILEEEKSWTPEIMSMIRSLHDTPIWKLYCTMYVYDLMYMLLL